LTTEDAEVTEQKPRKFTDFTEAERQRLRAKDARFDPSIGSGQAALTGGKVAKKRALRERGVLGARLFLRRNRKLAMPVALLYNDNFGRKPNANPAHSSPVQRPFHLLRWNPAPRLRTVMRNKALHQAEFKFGQYYCSEER
jgi:hypothetical protein